MSEIVRRMHRMRVGYLEDHHGGQGNPAGLLVRCDATAETLHFLRGPVLWDRVIRWPDDPALPAEAFDLVVADWLAVGHPLEMRVIDSEGISRTIATSDVASIVAEFVGVSRG